MVKLSLVVLVSGNGSNLQAIIDAIKDNKIEASIDAVISNKATAYGLTRAQQHAIPTHIISNNASLSREQYDDKLMACINSYQPSLIILAGFMRILSEKFVKHYPFGCILNVHPSLLPKYPGLHTHEQIIANRDTQHGATVHVVTAELDNGPIICQARLTVTKKDTVETLKQRVHQLEHRLYPQVIQWFAKKTIKIHKNQIFYRDQVLTKQGLLLNEQ